jgi:hypothetical protein
MHPDPVSVPRPVAVNVLPVVPHGIEPATLEMIRPSRQSRVVRLAVYIPLYWPFEDDEFLWARFEVLKHEILDLSGKIDILRDLELVRGNRAPEFALVPFTKCPPLAQWLLTHDKQLPRADILRAKVDVTVARRTEGEGGRDNVVRIGAGIENLLMRIMLAASLAKPGGLQLGEGIVIHDGRWLMSTPKLMSDIVYAERYVREIGWPSIRELPLEQMFTWLPDDGADLQDRPMTPLGRAMHAATYLYGESGPQAEIDAMIYSLLGLEALYTDSHDGISEQISSKAQLFLGEMSSFKKALKQMYNVRSRFLHGDLDFPPSTTFFGEWSRTRVFDEVERASALASMLLIATLQEMCIQGLSQLRFKLVLDASK